MHAEVLVGLVAQAVSLVAIVAVEIIGSTRELLHFLP
jgi:hypothetical protein